MNKIQICGWPFVECFAVFRDNVPVHSGDNLANIKQVELSVKDNLVYISIKEELFEFAFTGDCNGLREGDILYISNSGLITLLYSSDTSEIDLFLTNKCNSNCIMCPLSESTRKKNNPFQYQWNMDFINVLPADISYINITGGEPTLDKDKFLKTMEAVKSKFQFSEMQLLTNGRSFADGLFLQDALACMPSHMRFAVPLHSCIPEIHDFITRAPESFKQTDRGIRNLLLHNQKVEIRIVLSKLNINSVWETVQYICEQYNGVFVVNFIGMEMMGNAVINKELLWDEYSTFFRQIRDSIVYLVQHGIDTQLYNFPLCAVSRGFWPITVKSITEHKIRYKDECSECAVKKLCGGFFYSTLNVINPRVKVIQTK